MLLLCNEFARRRGAGQSRHPTVLEMPPGDGRTVEDLTAAVGRKLSLPGAPVYRLQKRLLVADVLRLTCRINAGGAVQGYLLHRGSGRSIEAACQPSPRVPSIRLARSFASNLAATLRAFVSTEQVPRARWRPHVFFSSAWRCWAPQAPSRAAGKL